MGGAFDELAEWKRSRAAETDRVVVLEEALLGGRFLRYALRRLTAFFAVRLGATILHVIELTWLFEIFSAKPFMASLAFQNAGLVIDALLWGALEGLRRRARELGPSSEAAALTTRWLGVALRLGAVVLALPILYALYKWWDDEQPPTMLNAYALVCAFRLAADAVVRTYYSGIFAFRRVARPMWAVALSPFIVIAVTLALWRPLAGWSFPIALFVSVTITRGVIFVFTRRAFRRHRVPAPSFRLALRSPRLGRDLFGEAALAGLANLTSRLGALVLLAAVIPSLATNAASDEEGGAVIAPFALALHLASPLLFIASQWAFVFYHDYKRLEGGASAELVRALGRRLYVTSVFVGVFSWLSASVLILFYVRVAEVWPLLAALLVASLGLSFWTAAQLHGFVHGEFIRQVVSAAVMLGVITAVLAATWTDTIVWYIALAAAPWTAVLADAIVRRLPRSRAIGVSPDLATWTRALGAAKSPVVTWSAALVRPISGVADRIASQLGARGAVVQTGDRLVWFERVPAESRAAWLRLGAGLFTKLDRADARSGADVLALLESRQHLTRPMQRDLRALCTSWEQAFPGGFVIGAHLPPPRRYLALAPEVRQEIWRDGLRRHTGGRPRGSHAVWAFAPDGPVEALFAVPKPVDSAKASTWARELRRASWRVGQGREKERP